MIGECRDKLLQGITHRGINRSPATVVRYLAALSHVYTVAVNEWGWLENNPIRKVKKPKESRGRVRYLSDEERTKLLGECKRSKNGFLYPVVVLAISTGMRCGEIMNLTWSDVDLQRHCIILQETKNGERRNIPLVGHALVIMKEFNKVRRLGTNYIFPGNDHKKPACLRRSWVAALNNAGIKDFRFHDLRHSAASYLAMNGATLSEIAEVLGHKTLAMVKRYAHISEQHTSKVVASMNEKIFGEA
jgi:integrase